MDIDYAWCGFLQRKFYLLPEIKRAIVRLTQDLQKIPTFNNFEILFKFQFFHSFYRTPKFTI